jgi:hypothetical protein
MGKANTGKNTLSKMIVRNIRKQRNLYSTCRYIAFADPIKEMIRQMFPAMPRKFLYGSSRYRSEIVPGAFKDGVPLTVRQLLIDLGTGMGREYMPRIWLDNFDYRFDRLARRDPKIVVVTDVRFRNEFEHLRNLGFYQIRLYRNTGQPEIQHISETGQEAIRDDEFNYVLFNDKGLKDLKLEVAQRIVPQLYDH